MPDHNMHCPSPIDVPHICALAHLHISTFHRGHFPQGTLSTQAPRHPAFRLPSIFSLIKQPPRETGRIFITLKPSKKHLFGNFVDKESKNRSLSGQPDSSLLQSKTSYRYVNLFIIFNGLIAVV